MELTLEHAEDMWEDASIDEATRQILWIFLDSINDWPDEVTSLDGYIAAIIDFIKTDATYESLTNFLASPNGLSQGWQATSIMELTEIYEHCDKALSLHQINEQLKSVLLK